MIWIPLLSVPLALALVKLGAAITMASVLKSAVTVALVLLVMLAIALAWALRRRGQIL
jgi:hypothetical protein